MDEEEWEENPFENRPAIHRAFPKESDQKHPSISSSAEDENPFEARDAAAGTLEDEENPFENRPSSTAFGYELDEDYVEIDEFDKSKLSFLSGIGFVALAFVMYFFVIVHGDLLLLGLSITSIIISALVAFFYLLDDLRIQTSSLTERGARFISGIFFMILVIILFAPLVMNWPNTGEVDITIPLTLLPIIVLAHASVALFLYSMLWEE